MQNNQVGAGSSSADRTDCVSWSRAEELILEERGHKATCDLISIIMFMDQSNIPDFSSIIDPDIKYPNSLQSLRLLKGQGALNRAAAPLVRYGQMSRNNANGVMALTNPGLHAEYYAKMSTAEKHFPHLAALFILLRLFPGEPKSGQDMQVYLGRCNEHLPHVMQHLVRAMQSEMAMSADSANLAMNAIRYVSGIGQLRQLKELLSILHAVCKKFKGDQHGLTLADALHLQAWMHVKLVRQSPAPTPKDAIDVTKKALQYRQSVLKSDDPAIAASFGNLAVFTIATAQYEDSLKYSELCLDILLKTEPNETEKISRTYLYYGWCYAKMNNFEQAEKYFKLSLEVMKNQFDDGAQTKPQAIWAKCGLGNLYLSNALEKEAFEQHMEAHNNAKLLYGHSSPGVFTTWYKIIWYRACQSDKEHHMKARKEAEQMLREMQRHEAYDGHIARTQYLLAVILEKLDKPAESKALKDKAYAAGKELNKTWKPQRGEEDFEDFDELVFFHDR